MICSAQKFSEQKLSFPAASFGNGDGFRTSGCDGEQCPKAQSLGVRRHPTPWGMRNPNCNSLYAAPSGQPSCDPLSEEGREATYLQTPASKHPAHSGLPLTEDSYPHITFHSTLSFPYITSSLHPILASTQAEDHPHFEKDSGFPKVAGARAAPRSGSSRFCMES